jgi:diguanylate cyclase (GGDEF)-like protein
MSELALPAAASHAASTDDSAADRSADRSDDTAERAVDDRAVLRAVAHLATLAATPGSPDDVLRELCVVAALVMEVDGIGVMEVAAGEPTGRVRFVHAELAVHEVERLQGVLQTGPCRDAVDTGEVVAVADVAGVVERYGELAERMLGAGMHAVLAVPLVGRGRTWGSLDLYRRRAGAWADDDVETARLLADVAVSYLVMASDRDEARAARREVEHRALHDSLTGVPNRVLLFDRIEHALASGRRHDTLIGVAFVDLDRFKSINDTYGHAAGDDVLVEVARRLGSTVRSQDTLARLAGDEFVVVLTDLPVDDDARRAVVTALGERLRHALLPPIAAGGGPGTGADELAITVTASIGVVVPDPARTPAPGELVHEADLAMYRAKGRRDAVVVHDAVADARP